MFGNTAKRIEPVDALTSISDAPALAYSSYTFKYAHVCVCVLTMCPCEQWLINELLVQSKKSKKV